jgi:hypothetical protein
MTAAVGGPGQAARTLAEKYLHRNECIERITALMQKEGPKTIGELSERLSISRSRVAAYLYHMESELRTARRSGKYLAQRVLWELGADPLMPMMDDALDKSFAARRRIVPACQVGMARDWLVAALFGEPAQGAAA